MLFDFWDTFVAILTNYRPQLFFPVLFGLASTVGLLWYLGGRIWAVIYVMMIPFLNWSFGVVPNIQFIGPWVDGDNPLFSWARGADPGGLLLHPLTLVTGLVFVIRDFVQREMRQWVLIAMLLALCWSTYYAWIVIVVASATAFFISEFFDWLLFTFTKLKLSQRILVSSAVAAPIDTVVFLYGADVAHQVNSIQTAAVSAGAPIGTWEAVAQVSESVAWLGGASLPMPNGNTLFLANIIVFIIGKMVGAFVVSDMIRRREDAGITNPYEDHPAQSSMV